MYPEVRLLLKSKVTLGAWATGNQVGIWHLEIPAGPQGLYRLAQLDDYTARQRAAFPWKPPLTLKLKARASSKDIPGTWGFGFWNDPFSLSLGLGGGTRRFPALPNAAWFFMASAANYLSLRDDLPAQGALAATFQSPWLPVQVLGAFVLPLFFWSSAARLLRQLGQRLIVQDAAALSVDLMNWHSYTLVWQVDEAAFYVDETLSLKTKIVPKGPLGLVVWIDNQYAALPPDGRLAFGTLANPEPAWIEIASIEVVPGT